MSVDPSVMSQPPAFTLPGQGQSQGGHRVFSDADGRWWEYDPTRPEAARVKPVMGPDGKQLTATKDPTPKADVVWDPETKRPYQVNHDAQGNATLTPITGLQPGAPTHFETPQGTVIYGPTADDPNPHFSLLPGTGPTPPNPQITTNGRSTIRVNPDGTSTVIYTDAAGQAMDQEAINNQRAQQQAERDRIALTAQGQQITSRGQDIQGFNAYWQNIINAGQADEQARQNQFKIDTTLNYDMPRQQVADENAALTSRFNAAQTIGQYETNRFNAGRGAAQDRWLGYMQSLPYRASPQFVQEYSQRAAQEAQGVPIGQRTAYSPAALTISGPSMDAQRQAGYAEAGVTGGLPTFDQVLAKAPAFAAMDPAELKKYHDMLMFAYQPPPRSAA